MKVLICGPTQGVWGGIEAFQLELGKFLSRQPAVEVKVAFKLVHGYAFQSDLRRVCAASGVECAFVERASRELMRLIAWADVGHGQNSSPDICVPSFLRRRPLVLTLHNHLRVKSLLRLVAWKACARLAVRRWYNSNYVRDSWEQTAPSLVSETFPTVSFERFDFAPLASRRGFVFLSRWIENKGAEVLLEAYAQARLDRAQWPLHLMGSGPLLEGLRARYGDVAGVNIHGFVTDAEKRERTRAARWLVAPPHTGEDMGLTPLEARSNGIPCIVTRDGGLPEVAGPDAPVVAPGSVETLRVALESVARWDEADYERHARESFTAVQREIRPLSFYVETYRSLVSRRA